MHCSNSVPFTLCLCLGFVIGCSQGEKTAQPDDGQQKLQIAVIPKGTTHEFWKSVHLGALRAAEEAGNVEILWEGPLREDDTTGQMQKVQDFIAQQVDGIVLAPLDSTALIRPVGEAIDAGIPVVIFDSALGKGPEIVSHVATDNYHGGQLAADRLAEALGGKGEVILLRYKVGSQSTEQRESGFLDRMKEKHPGITVIESDEYAGTTPDEALSKATQVLSKYRDQVDGIFAVCEPNANGTLQALSNTGLAGKVKFVAFDPSPALIRGLEEGTVHGIVLQDPVTMGYKAVQSMIAALNGESVKKRVQTGEHVATPENMDEPRMQKLLTPAEAED